MLVRSYNDVHTPNVNCTLLYNCNSVDRGKNYWLGKDDHPHNYIEEYLHQWYNAFLTGDYVGLEYWVYGSEKGNSFDPFHFDKDEMDPQIEHPKWSAVVNLTYDHGATCISDMVYGDLRPSECIYSYGNESKTVIWDGNVAWADLAGDEDRRLYINVWTTRQPKGLSRTKEMPYYPMSMIKGMYEKDKIIPYDGEYITHTHICQDMFDQFVLKEPSEIEPGCTYRVEDVVLY